MKRENEIVHVVGMGLMERWQAEGLLAHPLRTTGYNILSDELQQSIKNALESPAFDGKENK